MFWPRKPKKSEETRAKQERSLQEIEAGRIPLIAQERLKKHVESGNKFFTSDLSTREFLLTKNQKIEPICQVMGSSFVKVNLWTTFFRSRLQTGEMTGYSDALLRARKHAVDRLRQEAEMLNASGVVGVRVQAGARPWCDNLREFTAIGTAVRIPGWKHGTFVSDLSGQEFWQLYSAGYRPVNLAFGVSSYYMRMDSRTKAQMYSFLGINASNNQEIDLFTQGFYTARSRAMGHMERDVLEGLGDGVVGVDIEYDFERVELNSDDRTAWDLLVHFTALGTAVVHDPELKSVEVSKPLFCINLKDKTLRTGKKSRLRELDSKTIQGMPEQIEMEYLEKLQREGEE